MIYSAKKTLVYGIIHTTEVLLEFSCIAIGAYIGNILEQLW